MFLQHLRLQNLLSYGMHGVELKLGNLNVLIGPNASGKSNLIELIGLLSWVPRDLQKAVRDGGGASEWISKGGPQRILPDDGLIAVQVETPVFFVQKRRLYYEVRLSLRGARLGIKDEILRDVDFPDRVLLPAKKERGLVELAFSMASEDSILKEIRDLVQYPDLTVLGSLLGRIKLYRGWSFGRDSAIRHPQLADLPEDFLLEDGSNLALVLNDLDNRPGLKKVLLEELRKFYAGVENFTTTVRGGTVQIFFQEAGLSKSIPATRLSDGTLQYLCLLSILCHPNPPPLICIEEPEVGLHPDIIPEVARLLIDASQRTQLIVTTHSEMLVSALSEVPESIIVCERDDNGTQLRRLEPEKLKEWLERYKLGELWSMGEIGGNP